MTFEEQSREYKFRGHAFDVVQVEMKLPDGRTRKYDLVDHSNAVTILPIDEHQNVYFVKQYRLGANEVLLELPAGVLDLDEDPGEAALRELREETGMAGRLELLGTFYLAAGYSNEKMFVYLAQDLYASPLNQDEDEFLQLVKMPLTRVMEMISENEIHDAKTLAALILAQRTLSSSQM